LVSWAKETHAIISTGQLISKQISIEASPPSLTSGVPKTPRIVYLERFPSARFLVGTLALPCIQKNSKSDPQRENTNRAGIREGRCASVVNLNFQSASLTREKRWRFLRHPRHSSRAGHGRDKQRKAKRVNVRGGNNTSRRALPAAEPYFIASNIIAVGIPAPRVRPRDIGSRTSAQYDERQSRRMRECSSFNERNALPPNALRSNAPSPSSLNGTAYSLIFEIDR